MDFSLRIRVATSLGPKFSGLASSRVFWLGDRQFRTDVMWIPCQVCSTFVSVIAACISSTSPLLAVLAELASFADACVSEAFVKSSRQRQFCWDGNLSLKERLQTFFCNPMLAVTFPELWVSSLDRGFHASRQLNAESQATSRLKQNLWPFL